MASPAGGFGVAGEEEEAEEKAAAVETENGPARDRIGAGSGWRVERIDGLVLAAAAVWVMVRGRRRAGAGLGRVARAQAGAAAAAARGLILRGIGSREKRAPGFARVVGELGSEVLVGRQCVAGRWKRRREMHVRSRLTCGSVGPTWYGRLKVDPG